MIEKHTSKTNSHSAVLSKPTLNYGVESSVIENKDSDYHYCYQNYDANSLMVPNGYEVVNINETGEKPAGYSEKMRIKDGKVFLDDTILCRIPKTVMAEREAARKWRQDKLIGNIKKDNKRTFERLDMEGGIPVKVDQELSITKNK